MWYLFHTLDMKQIPCAMIYISEAMCCIFRTQSFALHTDVLLIHLLILIVWKYKCRDKPTYGYDVGLSGDGVFLMSYEHGDFSMAEDSTVYVIVLILTEKQDKKPFMEVTLPLFCNVHDIQKTLLLTA